MTEKQVQSVAWWHEVKKPRGKPTPAQLTFADHCAATPPCVCGKDRGQRLRGIARCFGCGTDCSDRAVGVV